MSDGNNKPQSDWFQVKNGFFSEFFVSVNHDLFGIYRPNSWNSYFLVGCPTGESFKRISNNELRTTDPPPQILTKLLFGVFGLLLPV